MLAGGLGHGRDGFERQILARVDLRFDLFLHLLVQLLLLRIINQVHSELLAKVFESIDRSIEVLASLSEHAITGLTLGGFFLELKELLFSLGKQVMAELD